MNRYFIFLLLLLTAACQKSKLKKIDGYWMQTTCASWDKSYYTELYIENQHVQAREFMYNSLDYQLDHKYGNCFERKNGFEICFVLKNDNQLQVESGENKQFKLLFNRTKLDNGEISSDTYLFRYLKFVSQCDSTLFSKYGSIIDSILLMKKLNDEYGRDTSWLQHDEEIIIH